MFAANIEWTAPKTNEMASLDSFLQTYLKKFKLPAIAAAVVSSDQIIAAGAVGVRKMGDDAQVTLNDKFHIGSCTKSITALLATMLAADGKISLDLKVGDVFPDWDLSPEQQSITLSMLLRNRSGLGNNPPPALWSKAFSASGTPMEQRAWFLRAFLKTPLAAKPDEKFIYSNVGYALAGAMIETKLKTQWETLIRERIFEPLHLKSAGFGTPTSKNDPNEPWGHQMKDGKYQPIEPYDNPPAIAPGAAVHCSILDLARYADFHMQVARGEIETLKPFQKFLYTPPANSNYAAGWLVEKRDWAGGKVITHAGSNTMFYTVIWIAPEKNFAFVLSTNAADSQGGLEGVAQQCDQIIGALIRKFVK
jgi:CubicO group peptidase (beta-lactamase class C family)